MTTTEANDDDASRINCRCTHRVSAADDEPVLIPSADCELHWRQVIDADPPPADLFP
jgi:hypothetical protein